jgi:RNA polymerase sigma factor (sigma-70 family)
MQTTDLHLYAQWRNHRNAQAFNELARRHAGMVFGTCQRILRSAADAEEVAQECFEALAATAHGPARNLGGWLHALATRRALNRLKSEMRRREREQAFAEAKPAAMEPQWDDIYPIVDEAIATLPDKLREPLVRSFFEGQTHEAIAAELGVSRGAVTYRIAQGVERIRKHLKQRGVLTTAVALSALLAENLASAETPAALTDAIARMALAGPPMVAPVVASPALSSAVFWKASALLVGAVLAAGVVTGAWHLLLPEPGGLPLSPIAYGAPVAAVEPPTINTDPTTESAQEPNPQDMPELPVFTATLAGRAVDDAGNPVVGATVTLDRNFQPMWLSTWSSPDPLAPYHATGTTDDMGFFTFAVPTLVHTSSANNGYHTFHLSASHGDLGSFRQIDSFFVGPGNNHVELAMEPLSQIAGIIVDSAGKPVLPSDIQVQKRIGGNASFQDWKIYRTTPNFGEDGSFAIQGLSPGRYFLRVIAEGHPPGEVEAVTGQKDVRIELPAPLHVSGVVRDENTGRPAPGVKLVAFSNPEFSQEILSDATGAFSITGLKSYGCTLWLSQGNQPYVMEPLSHRLDLSDGQSIESLDISVYQGGTVTGRVINARTGLSIPGGVVQASIPDRPENEIGDSLGWRVPVDSEGRFQIEGLPRGSYIFIAEDAGAKPTFQEVYPGRLYENVDVFVEPGISVAGQVLDIDGNGASNTIVIAEADSNPYPQKTCTDDAGCFVLWWKEEPMEAKTIRLQAMTSSTLSAVTPDMPLNPKGIDGVVLRLEPAGVLEAEVRYVGGSPAAGAKVVLAPQTPGVDVIGFHKSPNNNQTHYSGGLEATSTASGRVFLGPLPLGSYVVKAHPPGLDSTNLVTTQTVQVGEEPATIQLTLNSSLKTRPAVAGQVTLAGVPLVDAEIGLSPLEPGQKGQWARSDAEGRYRFDEVLLGAAHLRATYTPPGQDSGRSRNVSVGEIAIANSGDTVVDIAFGTGSGVVEGVVTIGGQPVADVSVGVHVRGDESVFTTTDTNGYYAVEAISEGRISVNAMQGKKDEEDRWVRSYEGILSPGERLRIDFSLGTGQVEGTVSGLSDTDSMVVAALHGAIDVPNTLEEMGVLVQSEAVAAATEASAGNRFRLINLEPGVYTLIASVIDAEEENYRIASVKVEVADGKVTEVTMSLSDARP